MAATSAPVPAYPDDPSRRVPRPNIATADVRLPAVRSYEQVDAEIMGTLHPSLGWFALLGIAIVCMLIGACAWTYQIYEGLGAAGYQPPVMWGVYIVTFVFWVGIGHAGTLISAILYLFRAGFRTSIYRAAEAMTVFAVMTAGLFPILHLGRPWKFFWLIPYPNWRLIWPNPKSPLVWDVFPIRKYFKLQHYVTLNDIDAAAKMCLFTSLVVGLAYLTEFQVAWMSGSTYEQDYFWNRVFGQWAWAAWIMLICNCVLPLSLFSQKLRRNTTWLWILSLFINLGMWFERFVIVVPSLSHEFEPWQWSTYAPTWVDSCIALGSFGWFFMWFLLFIKQLPVMAMSEITDE